jgi:prepilin-type N-terminal cleavage/methylation domain-containing protein
LTLGRLSNRQFAGKTIMPFLPTRFGVRRAAFTLVELLVVIAIIGVMVALLLPAVQQAREAARRTQCLNHLKQMALAAQNYHDSHSVYPPGRIIPGNRSGANGHKSIAPWQVTILPYIEQKALYDS